MIRRRLPILGLGLATLLLSLPAIASASETPSPRFEVTVVGQPTNFAPGDETGFDVYYIDLINVGDAPTSGAITISDALASDLTPVKIAFGAPTGEEPADTTHCSLLAVRCKYPSTSAPIPPGVDLQMHVYVHVASTPTSGTLANTVTVSGGGAPSVATSTSNPLGAVPAPYGLNSLSALPRKADGTPFTAAAAHPDALLTSFALNTQADTLLGSPSEGLSFASEQPKDISLDLPPGVIGNPRAVPQCPLADFVISNSGLSDCPADTQVGTVEAHYSIGLPDFGFLTPLYNLAPEPGVAAELGYQSNIGVSQILTATLRSGSDYGLRLAQSGVPIVGITSAIVTTWGIPADPRHDPVRGLVCSDGVYFENAGPPCHGGGLHSDQPERPFLRLSSDCSAASPLASISSDSWEFPGRFAERSAGFPPVDACSAVPFRPSLQARPTTNLPDEPSGLDVDLHVAPEEAPNAVSSADLKDTTVALPAGIRLDPSSAWGLQGCTESQIGYKPGTAAPFEFTPGHPACPDSSKLGTVSVDTQLLSHPLQGSVYLATPHQNPFGSLLALYVVIDDPVSGVIVKLPARVSADPVTGQLTTTVEEAPQLPFEDFRLHFYPGAEGALRTPTVCGAYQSTSILTPWSAPESGPPAEPSDQFQIAGACAQSESSEPNNPLFDAGPESPQAGQFSPFAFRLARSDGSQEISKIETVLPPGLTGKLAGVGECPESAIAQAKGREHDGGGAEELASPSCPASSEVGTVEVGAGAGPDPYHTHGRAYLAGPYAGAPLSLVIITPAVAGPFDLGNVVVRAALYVDPRTAQITAKSDPIPRIIDGIPLDVRSIVLKMNRPNFTLNPTSCNPLSIGGSETSVLNQSAPLAQRFQVGGCNALAFKPHLKLSLKGGTKRSKFPALKATLTMKPGEANVAQAQVTLPHSSFLANAHIDKTCSHPELESHSCPASSVYGHARAWSPLLEAPLEGDVYLVTGFGYELPALVADLQGQIEVQLVGKVDTGRADGIRNTFEVVPDAPVSKFVLEMAGGKRGLIENSEDLCAKHAKRKALAEFTAQSGRVWDIEPVVGSSCGGKRRHHHRRK